MGGNRFERLLQSYLCSSLDVTFDRSVMDTLALMTLIYSHYSLYFFIILIYSLSAPFYNRTFLAPEILLKSKV